MKKSVLLLAAVFLLCSCSVRSDKSQLPELKDGFTSLKAEALFRDGMVHYLYPDIDVSEITALPVYKITEIENNDLLHENAIEFAEKLNINLDFVSAENCTVHDKHSEFPTSECIFKAENKSVRFRASDSDVFISDNDRGYQSIKISALNSETAVSVCDYCNDTVYMNKIGLDFPENIKNIKLKNNENIITENEEHDIGEWLRKYINEHKDIFPFTVEKFHVEHNMALTLNANNELVGRYHTDVYFYKDCTASATDALLGYYDFTDYIKATYVVINIDGYELAEVIFTFPKETFIKEKIADYKLISYRAAEQIFKKGENVNYSDDADAESIKDYELRLAYVLDNNGYARPVYVKQNSFGWFSKETAWIDAIG